MAELAIQGGRALLSQAPRALATAASRAVMSSLFGEDREGPRLSEIPVQTSTDGAAMPRLWGRMRLAGQVIWAARFTESTTEHGGKGGPTVTEYSYAVSFAVGLCEGVISGIGRVWANGALLDQSACTMRVYRGDESQLPDALVQAVEGAEAPAFRGTAYVLFEDLPLDAYGGRIPNLSFEVFRAEAREGALEQQVRGVNLIPGSGEFALHPDTVMRQIGAGHEIAENRNTARGVTDFEAALDDLARDLPECRSVQLVVSWFGTDLRCDACEVRPGVETRDKQTDPVSWRVTGETRATAWLVSQTEGRPNYGGTPCDESVIAAIRALKARGYSVTLYPFILMDIPAGNGFDDPYGDAEQAAFPWRGRITLPTAAAPGSAAADTAVDAFFGAARASDFILSGESVSYSGPAGWGFNRFILHCAALAQAAGGVDGFLIGSELVSLTTIRGASGFPAVDALIALAGEARNLLGPQTRLSYAADWTEYSGVSGPGGEKYFHLDPLWACADIDAVAIDWYAPLTDWRDGTDHLDALAGYSLDDPAYLRSGLTGGEGHDWYYASESDRAAQQRTPITDGAHDEAWVWRVKDLVSWWSQAHHDRPGGVRSATPTAWQAGMKPVWLTEIGCPAVDKGTNQPNVFYDPKSAESRLPHFSTGVRDDAIQRLALETQLDWWSGTGEHNPLSAVYGGPMVAADWIHVWAFDARPWPDFPGRSEVWSDGDNWERGHWLNGRAGLIPVRAILDEVCTACGVDTVDTTGVADILPGYVQTSVMRGRDILSPLLDVLGVEAFERTDGLLFRSAGAPATRAVLEEPVAHDAEPAERIELTAGQDRASDLRFGFIDGATDYTTAQVRVADPEASGGVRRLSAPLVCDPYQARDIAAAIRQRGDATMISRHLALPPSCLAIEAGDWLAHAGQDWLVAGLDGDATREARLRPGVASSALRAGSSGEPGDEVSVDVRPDLALIDLSDTGLWVAAAARNGAGAMAVEVDPGSGVWDQRGTLSRNARMGYLTANCAGGRPGRWDRGGVVELELVTGTLAGLPDTDVLAGGNRLAVSDGTGGWTIIQFAGAELVAERRYRLTNLLWGLSGTLVPDVLSAGAQCVLLDEAVAEISLLDSEIGRALRVRAGRGRKAERTVTPGLGGLKPYAPVHLGVSVSTTHVQISWIRRTRSGGDAWWRSEVPLGEASERYRVEVRDGDLIVWTGDVSAPSCSVPRTALPGSGALEMRVCQLSEAVGEGGWAAGLLVL